jgi:putative acetyltransferase
VITQAIAIRIGRPADQLDEVVRFYTKGLLFRGTASAKLLAMSISIREARPDSDEAVRLITELESHLHPDLYPPESRHGFSVEKLVRENVAFFIAEFDAQPAGCGGIKLFSTDYGEVKRMFVRPPYRGFGLGKAILNQLAEHAQQNRVNVLRLETGIYQTEAIGLYERYGFQRRPPFGEYREDPLSVYYEKLLA